MMTNCTYPEGPSNRAAKALGISTSAYARSRLLEDGPDVLAWRQTYLLIVKSIEVAAIVGVSPDVQEILDNLKSEFEEIAATVFPNPPE